MVEYGVECDEAPWAGAGGHTYSAPVLLPPRPWLGTQSTCDRDRGDCGRHPASALGRGTTIKGRQAGKEEWQVTNHTA